MKTPTTSIQQTRPATRETSIPALRFNTNSLPCLVLAVMISAIPAVALVVFAAWATGAPTLLPAVQAATGLSGLVFLALAIESRGPAAVVKILTAAALFASAYASLAIAIEFMIVGMMIASAWLGAGLFMQFTKHCR